MLSQRHYRLRKTTLIHFMHKPGGCMGINTMIREFQAKIVLDINESKLPPAVTALVLENILNLVREAERKAVTEEQKESGENGDSIRDNRT